MQPLEQTRATILARPAADPGPRTSQPAQPGHGPRPQPTLPIVEVRHELRPDARQCPACGGTLVEMTGQVETSDRITTVTLTYQVEHHVRQKYRCACNGAVVTAPGPAQVIPGGRCAPEFAVGVAVAKYADHLPLERQVRMMARDGLIVDSQTLIGLEVARWLVSKRVSMTGADSCCVQAQPPVTTGPRTVHHELLNNGMLMLENMDLRDLARDRVYSCI